MPERKLHKLLIYSIFSLLLCTVQSAAQDSISIDATPVDSQKVFTDTIDYSGLVDMLGEEVEETGPSFLNRVLSNDLLPAMGIVWFILFVLLQIAKRLARSLITIVEGGSSMDKVERYDLKEYLSSYKATISTIKYCFPASILLYLLYVAVAGNYMQGYVMEWLNLLIRWAHVVAGIMWIGASFYFVFLENNLNRTKGLRDELAGNLWAVHGGGFYFLEKYKVAPKEIPKDLHWFKYEAYFTLITGLALLVVVYYLDAKAFMVDPSIAEISVSTAILIGLGALVIGWIVYDLMCKSPLVEKPLLFAAIGFALITLASYFLTQFLNPRAAFIHIGAMIGVIMVGNVYFNIIPAQKAMVRSATLGLPLDASLGKKAGQRSYHNNYFTLPVIFVMISNHFPSTFGHEYNWLVLAALFLISAAIKHFWNLAEKGHRNNKLLVSSLIGLFALALVISPAFEARMDLAIPVSFQEANEIIQKRCVSCHSANPSDDIWKVAPNGVMYDTPDQIQIMSDKIMTRAVRSKTMPQGNKTGMTDDERKVLKRWIMQGAKIDQ